MYTHVFDDIYMYIPTRRHLANFNFVTNNVSKKKYSKGHSSSQKEVRKLLSAVKSTPKFLLSLTSATCLFLVGSL